MTLVDFVMVIVGFIALMVQLDRIVDRMDKILSQSRDNEGHLLELLIKHGKVTHIAVDPAWKPPSQ